MNNINEKLVKIVIPVYKSSLDKHETVSLKQCYSVLSRYPIAIVKPKSLSLEALCNEFPLLEIENFDDDFFENLESYNRLMLSSIFYERFLDYKYILIYQLDAYVFRDALESWCKKSYNYIGAPWIKRHYVLKQIKSLFNKITGKKVRRPYSDAYYKAGNGGFSLRRTQSFYEIINNENDLINIYLHPPQAHSRYMPEDIFWALEPQRKNYAFRTPEYKEALLFSFDKYPKECFKITKAIPFGCHGWNRKKNFSFWKKFIG